MDTPKIFAKSPQTVIDRLGDGPPLVRRIRWILMLRHHRAANPQRCPFRTIRRVA